MPVFIEEGAWPPPSRQGSGPRSLRDAFPIFRAPSSLVQTWPLPFSWP